MTIGELKKIIEDLPDDMEVVTTPHEYDCHDLVEARSSILYANIDDSHNTVSKVFNIDIGLNIDNVKRVFEIYGLYV